jgi:hypothetical protein
MEIKLPGVCTKESAMSKTHIAIHVPSDKDQKCLWAASIAQTAAILYVNSSDSTEEEAIGQAIRLYSGVIYRLVDAGALEDPAE